VLLKHLLGTAVPKYLDANPVTGLKDLHAPQADVRTLSVDEEARLLKRATVEERALVICALDTLQRLSNVAGLQRAQDHETYITVLNPKGGVGYKVPVSARLRSALSALPKNGPGLLSATGLISRQGPAGTSSSARSRTCVERRRFPWGAPPADYLFIACDTPVRPECSPPASTSRPCAGSAGGPTTPNCRSICIRQTRPACPRWSPWEVRSRRSLARHVHVEGAVRRKRPCL